MECLTREMSGKIGMGLGIFYTHKMPRITFGRSRFLNNPARSDTIWYGAPLDNMREAQYYSKQVFTRLRAMNRA